MRFLLKYILALILCSFAVIGFAGAKIFHHLENKSLRDYRTFELPKGLYHGFRG